MLIQAESLTRFASAIFVAGGAAEEDARITADHLVLANLKGHDSHGVGMIPSYVHGIKRNNLHVSAHAKIVHERGAVALVDGQSGLGQVVAKEATDIAIRKAKELGLASVGLRNAHHIGRIGTYGEQCASANLVSIHFVNVVGHLPIVSPFGGLESRLQTNPFCCAVPREGKLPIVLDMATSVIAAGKVRVAYNWGNNVSEGALIDHEGEPTTDPKTFFEAPRGSLLPFGLHKGFGLAFMCELLGGAMVAQKTIQPEHERPGKSINNMFTVVIDPGVFGGTEQFAHEVEAMVEYVHDTTPTGGKPVMIAGEPEQQSLEQRQREGIPIDEKTWGELVRSAEAVGLDEQKVNELAS